MILPLAGVIHEVQTSDNTAIFATLAGAITVAFIAAATAQWRLVVQLRHDRELKDVEELRKLVDEAAVLMADASDAAQDLGLSLEDGSSITEGLARLLASRIQLGTMHERIALRGVEAVRVALHRFIMAMPSTPDRDPAKRAAEAAKVEAAEETMDERKAEFWHAVSQLVGARVTPSGASLRRPPHRWPDTDGLFGRG